MMLKLNPTTFIQTIKDDSEDRVSIEVGEKSTKLIVVFNRITIVFLIKLLVTFITKSYKIFQFPSIFMVYISPSKFFIGSPTFIAYSWHFFPSSNPIVQSSKFNRITPPISMTTPLVYFMKPVKIFGTFPLQRLPHFFSRFRQNYSFFSIHNVNYNPHCV